jgi:hypothetical protein
MCRLPLFTALPSAVLLLVQFLAQRVALVSLRPPRFRACFLRALRNTSKHYTNTLLTMIAANSNNGHVVAHLSAVLILQVHYAL